MPPHEEATSKIIFLLVALALISIILARLEEYFAYWDLNPLGFWDAFYQFFLLHIWPFLKLAGLLFGVGAVIGSLDAWRKLRKINIEEAVIYGLAATPLSITDNYGPEKNERWEHVQNLSNSDNPSDWRLAILEADVMLEELLRSSGYHGDSVGEMLKSVEKSDFLTIEDAWEAHKVRNRVAHDGSSYLLNEREVRHVISLFENVFKEFEII